MYGLTNFGEGPGRDVHAVSESDDILVTHNNRILFCIDYLGEHNTLIEDLPNYSPTEEQFLTVIKYKDMVSRGWVKKSSWIDDESLETCLIVQNDVALIATNIRTGEKYTLADKKDMSYKVYWIHLHIE